MRRQAVEQGNVTEVELSGKKESFIRSSQDLWNIGEIVPGDNPVGKVFASMRIQVQTQNPLTKAKWSNVCLECWC